MVILKVGEELIPPGLFHRKGQAWRMLTECQRLSDQFREDQIFFSAAAKIKKKNNCKIKKKEMVIQTAKESRYWFYKGTAFTSDEQCLREIDFPTVVLETFFRNIFCGAAGC